MLHKVELPETSRRCLTKAMFWQFRLLRWALMTPGFSKDDCQGWLEKQPRYAQNATKIANWVCKQSSLRNFSNDLSTTSQVKRDWINQRFNEAWRLLRNPHGQLANPSDTTEVTSEWQEAAATFLIHFYDLFRSESGLPAFFFQRSRNQKYTAQEFLDAFLSQNDRLCVCPVCDSTAYFTILHRKEGLSVYTDIDHYLPKKIYPHLAIHPYNLIPLCHSCNSGVKTAEDPLRPKAREPYRLDEIWLPYRHSGLSTSLILKIISDEHPFNFTPFSLKSDSTSTLNISMLNDLLSRVYHIPERWQIRIDEIGEKLFRRIRDYIRFMNVETDDSSAIIYLDELLYLFDQEESSREPYAIAMMWLLAHLLISPQIKEPFMEEIKEWQQKKIQQTEYMREHGKRIRLTLNNEE